MCKIYSQLFFFKVALHYALSSKLFKFTHTHEHNIDDLKAIGLTEGDTVRIYGWEFTYYE